MTSSYWWVATAEKVAGFDSFSEYLKNHLTDFDQTYVMFRQFSIESFNEIKDWRQIIPCCHGNQFMRKCCWAKIMIEEKKSGIFLKI